jgi:hypothetical protein
MGGCGGEVRRGARTYFGEQPKLSEATYKPSPLSSLRRKNTEGRGRVLDDMASHCWRILGAIDVCLHAAFRWFNDGQRHPHVRSCEAGSRDPVYHF